jgi:hypothetical protein
MDQPNTEQKRQNPLSQWFRQPKIYIRLPSKGEFYPEGALDKSANDEYAVFAMTAKDELMFKTPDALLSGQTTVEVIKSCIPAILNPWTMPSVDLDAALIAIRIATYGEGMEVSADCPYCDHENDYEINLVTWLEKVSGFNFETEINIDPLTIHIRPYTYKEVTEASLKTFEQQRIIAIVNDENLSDEVKIEKFSESFVKLTELTVDTMAKCVWKISTPAGDVTNLEDILEFIQNSPKDVFQKISDHISKLKDKVALGEQEVACRECEKEFNMPIELDQSSFFGNRS